MQEHSPLWLFNEVKLKQFVSSGSDLPSSRSHDSVCSALVGQRRLTTEAAVTGPVGLMKVADSQNLLSNPKAVITF